LEIPAMISESYFYTIKLPEGMNLATPLAELILTPENELKISIKQEGNDLMAERSLTLNKSVIVPGNYVIFCSLINISTKKNTLKLF
jgi:hypothetical protein